MLITKHTGYNRFVCMADKCPKSCCSGWQVMIDDESIEKYRENELVYPEYYKGKIDYEEQCFKSIDGHCSMLLESGLCSLQKKFGEQILSRVCTDYPRHTEEFEGENELSLSLSCPEVARFYLSFRDKMQFSTDEIPDDFQMPWEEEELAELRKENEDPQEAYGDFQDVVDDEEFDFFLYDALSEARLVIFKIIQDRRISIADRMKYIMDMSRELQEAFDEERICDMHDISEKYNELGEFSVLYQKEEIINGENASSDNKSKNIVNDLENENKYNRECNRSEIELKTAKENKTRFNLEQEDKRDFEKLFELELLENDWGDILDGSYQLIFKNNSYEKAMDFMEECAVEAEQLLIFFTYTYFCGAVYSGNIFAKTNLAVQSVKSIFFVNEFLQAKGERTDEVFEKEPHPLLIKAAYLYAREIEHSDDNLNALEEYYMNKYDNEE